MQGTIRMWNPERYFGFIQTGAASVFFHGRSVIGGAGDLQVGMRVQFELGYNRRGECAERIEIIESDQARAASGV